MVFMAKCIFSIPETQPLLSLQTDSCANSNIFGDFEEVLVLTHHILLVCKDQNNTVAH